MAYKIYTVEEHFCSTGRPKRILACDGGGLRGILTIGILEKVEKVLRERHNAGDSFRLCHYFDLIAGTSTGSIIAAMLAKGWRVEDIRARYMDLAETVFEKSFLRRGLIRAKYDKEKLSEELRKCIGKNTKIGSDELKTGLLIVTKRMDTGSAWPISNNPRGQYYHAHSEGVVANSSYPLWKVVRASTAAPTYFDPESITIAKAPRKNPVEGEFVDGGMSCFNNPALQAFMFATLNGYRVNWPAGGDKLLLVSIGTGRSDPRGTLSSIAGKEGIQCAVSLMNDCADFQETILQWMSTSRTARKIDRELGDLRSDLLGGSPCLTYLRYNVDLSSENLKKLLPTLEDKVINSLHEMDAPENMQTLYQLGQLEAQRSILESDFPTAFDLVGS
jgi:uncharacterized protein